MYNMCHGRWKYSDSTGAAEDRWQINARLISLDLESAKSAAKYGYLSALQVGYDPKDPWINEICLIAAYHGQLEILKWAQSTGLAIKSEIL